MHPRDHHAFMFDKDASDVYYAPGSDEVLQLYSGILFQALFLAMNSLGDTPERESIPGACLTLHLKSAWDMDVQARRLTKVLGAYDAMFDRGTVLPVLEAYQRARAADPSGDEMHITMDRMPELSNPEAVCVRIDYPPSCVLSGLSAVSAVQNGCEVPVIHMKWYRQVRLPSGSLYIRAYSLD